MNQKTKDAISSKMKGNTNRVGKKHSYAATYAIKEANRKLKWWNDGVKEVRAQECPEGFVRGRISNKNTVWVNDGIKEVQIPEEEKTEDQVKGRLFSLEGYQWYSSNTRNFLKKEVPASLLESRRLHVGMVPTAIKRNPGYMKLHPDFVPKSYEWEKAHNQKKRSKTN